MMTFAGKVKAAVSGTSSNELGITSNILPIGDVNVLLAGDSGIRAGSNDLLVKLTSWSVTAAVIWG